MMEIRMTGEKYKMTGDVDPCPHFLSIHQLADFIGTYII
jgi:hypothetical protein